MEVGTPKSQNSSLGIRNVFGDDYPYAPVWFSSTKHVFLLAEWEGRSWSGAGFYTKMFKKSRTRLCCFQLEVLMTSTHLNTNVLRMIFCAKSWRSGLWLYIYLVQVKSTCHELSLQNPWKNPWTGGKFFLEMATYRKPLQEYYGLEAALGERPGCSDSLHATEVLGAVEGADDGLVVFCS